MSSSAINLVLAVYGALIASAGLVITYRGLVRTGINLSVEVKMSIPYGLSVTVRNKSTSPVSLEEIVADVVEEPRYSGSRRLTLRVQTRDGAASNPGFPYTLPGNSSVKWVLSDKKDSQAGLPGLTSRYGALLGHEAWRELDKADTAKFLRSHFGVRLGTGKVLYGGTRWLPAYHWSTWATGVASLYTTALLVAFVVPWPLAGILLALILLVIFLATRPGRSYRKSPRDRHGMPIERSIPR
ncbi:hypothetical protein [Actinacidiphila rubida]|uniref:Uncharacterized protein n=1 Tax=Actinacidiphila rubida TaxID=310780 RepID=A0A1H8L8T8_9ACTN|nr:hypothetical protein [Actinacidiphila rubida]SEO01527.1 hypothetical protein SAMN05216267_1015102 [Actinacidiphila rubida]